MIQEWRYDALLRMLEHVSYNKRRTGDAKRMRYWISYELAKLNRNCLLINEYWADGFTAKLKEALIIRKASINKTVSNNESRL